MWLEITGLALLYSVKQVMEFTEVLGITDKCFKSNRFFFKPLSFQLYSWTKSGKRWFAVNTYVYIYVYLKKSSESCVFIGTACEISGRARVCHALCLLTRLWSTLKKAIWQGLLSRLAKAMKASAVSRFRMSTAAMKDIPCTLKNTQTQSQYKRILTATLKPVTVRACTCQML